MKVSVIMGSMSDYAKVEQTVIILKKFGVDVDVQCLSAHRCSEELVEYLKETNNNGTEVIIAAAGMAAAGKTASAGILPDPTHKYSLAFSEPQIHIRYWNNP